MRRSRPPVLVTLAALVTAGVALSGCSSTGSSTAQHGVQVLASFYPLQYVAEQIGGDLVQVTSLTPPGAEPHDIELSPRQVRSVTQADLVVYLSGFQSAVDEAVTSAPPAHVVDVAHDVTLVPEAGGTGTLDPHFWLDPHLLAQVAAPVAAALSQADPSHAATYTSRAQALETTLGELDSQYTTGLATCQRHVIVTSHAAFGYLAARYHLEQVAVSGLDPEADPSPARLKEIADVVRAKGVTTIFSEQLLSPKVAQTLAGDLGITTAVLDPVESLAASTSDYRGVMQQNLSVLRTALGCS